LNAVGDFDNKANGGGGIGTREWVYMVPRDFTSFLFPVISCAVQPAYLAASDACGWSGYLTDCHNESYYDSPSADCKAATTRALAYLPKSWDPYDVFAPTCHATGKGKVAGTVEAYTPFLDNLRVKCVFQHPLFLFNRDRLWRLTPVLVHIGALLAQMLCIGSRSFSQLHCTVLFCIGADTGLTQRTTRARKTTSRPTSTARTSRRPSTCPPAPSGARAGASSTTTPVRFHITSSHLSTVLSFLFFNARSVYLKCAPRSRAAILGQQLYCCLDAITSPTPDTTGDVMVKYFERFFRETDWRVLVWSGDADAAVPFLGTQRWIECLGQPVVADWAAWQTNDATYGVQVGGMVKQFEGISFLTVKGCGHTVQSYCPQQGYDYYHNWLTLGQY